MKKYQIIGFTLWTLGSILLILRMWDYIFTAPVFAAQVAIWICFSILFCVDISSRGLFITINTTLVIAGLFGFFYFIYYRNPIGAINMVAALVIIIKNCLSERKQKVNCFLTKMLTILALITMLLSLIFTVRIFVTNKKTGLQNGFFKWHLQRLFYYKNILNPLLSIILVESFLYGIFREYKMFLFITISNWKKYY